MERKKVSIDLISYFLKFLFLILSLILLAFGIINIINFLDFVFDEFETKLCLYKSILNKNNIVSDFLITHNYNVFGPKSFSFIDETSSILSITIFLKLFECFKFLLFSVISFLIFYLLNRYSKNIIVEKKSNNYLLTISLLFIFIPFIYLLRDYIGCLLINNLGIKEPHIFFEKFKLFYLIIGVTLFNYYLYNYLFLNNKSLKTHKIFSTITNSIFILICSYYLISNLGNLFYSIGNENSKFIYNKLFEIKHEFISYLTSNSFEIFGYKYTYLGYYTELKTPIVLFYTFNSIIYISLIGYFIINLIKKSDSKIITPQLLLFGIFILVLVLNLLTMISVIDKYNDLENYNKQLKYSLINYEYLYIIIPMTFTYLLSLNNANLIQKEKGN